MVDSETVEYLREYVTNSPMMQSHIKDMFYELLDYVEELDE